MKHQHTADFKVKVELPTEEIEEIIDKATESVIMIIVAATAASIIKKLF